MDNQIEQNVSAEQNQQKQKSASTATNKVSGVDTAEQFTFVVSILLVLVGIVSGLMLCIETGGITTGITLIVSSIVLCLILYLLSKISSNLNAIKSILENKQDK